MLECHETTKDGKLAWQKCVNTYMLGETRELQMVVHEQVIQAKYYYPGYNNGIIGIFDDLTMVHLMEWITTHLY